MTPQNIPKIFIPPPQKKKIFIFLTPPPPPQSEIQIFTRKMNQAYVFNENIRVPPPLLGYI